MSTTGSWIESATGLKYDDYKRIIDKRIDKTTIFKEDVMLRIDRRMQTVIDCTDDESIKRELTLLKAFLLATVADM